MLSDDKLPIIEFLQCNMHAATMNATIDVILTRIEQEVFTQHVVVNVAKLINMKSDPALKEAVRACDIINIDGMGVVWGARLCKLQVPERVAGIDLFLNLLKEAANRNLTVFLLGAKPAVVENTVSNLLEDYPELSIAGYHHGYFWDNEEQVVQKIRDSNAALLFVALTSPKKENFINRWQDKLGVRFVMGVGGSFDVVAGKSKRAPEFLQRAGLEWLYRVYQEPRRMWRRYLHTNLQFLLLLLQEMVVVRLRR